ncbi:hypothetical protein PanWU01x14_044340 [Parasponia andersonii]|uniref:Uncharacterized protein n=1 Tax=Parasponia andersonii TaxID=3476 RepID=A0A2P5DP66_PARAD|nr:hypothetical protein PanWU01x14_044340 [Parasponia andersonii]
MLSGTHFKEVQQGSPRWHLAVYGTHAKFLAYKFLEARERWIRIKWHRPPKKCNHACETDGWETTRDIGEWRQTLILSFPSLPPHPHFASNNINHEISFN